MSNFRLSKEFQGLSILSTYDLRIRLASSIYLSRIESTSTCTTGNYFFIFLLASTILWLRKTSEILSTSALTVLSFANYLANWKSLLDEGGTKFGPEHFDSIFKLFGGFLLALWADELFGNLIDLDDGLFMIDAN